MAKQKFRVLVADDDIFLRELAANILSGEYEVAQAVDGQEAWEKAGTWKPDLVITDLMMPRMHGYELCGLLKGPEGVKGVRVLVVSSKSFATDKAQAEAAGADAYILKPFAADDLLKKVKELLHGADAGGTSAAAPSPSLVERDIKSSSGQAMSPAERPPVPGGFWSDTVNLLPKNRKPHKRLPVSVRFWGTRGSCPTSGPNTVRYGGNTACVEVRIGDDFLLIMDCGTGLRELGVSIVREFSGMPITGHMFVGHTHWDHIQGFPFFIPFYNPRNTFSVYSVHGAHGSLQGVFSGTMAADYFPIPLSSLAAKLHFVEMSGPVDLGLATVSFIHLNHPGICIGFRIDAQERSVVYLSDHESFVKLKGDNEISRRQDAEITAFAGGSDLLIMEAQYTEAEYAARKGWGHGTFDDAVRCAVGAGAKRLAVIHHDPEHSDEAMDAHIRYCRELAGGKTDCFAACEGLRVELP